MRKLQILVLAAAACVALPAQQAPLEFEVATVKPSEPINPAGGRVMMRVGPRTDGAMVTYSRMTLKQLVQNAYRVKDYQVTGAAWMDTQQYDISAKLPDGANKDQAPDMLQNLLKDRFKLAFHREKKDMPVFALVASKAGAKLKAADPKNAFTPPPGMPAPPPPPPPSADSKGGGLSAPQGQMRMMMTPNGGQVDARGITVARLAEMLSSYVSRPVFDETRIEGLYDFTLEVSPEEMSNLSGMKMMPMMAAMAAAGPGGPGGPSDGAKDPHGSIFQSIQAYGLKLDPKKAPVDIIVMDSAEKTPIEN